MHLENELEETDKILKLNVFWSNLVQISHVKTSLVQVVCHDHFLVLMANQKIC